jgi:hypothetical protein
MFENLELSLSEFFGFNSARGPAVLPRFPIGFPDSSRQTPDTVLQTGLGHFLPLYSEMALLPKVLRNNQFLVSFLDMETMKSVVEGRENRGLLATTQHVRDS